MKRLIAASAAIGLGVSLLATAQPASAAQAPSQFVPVTASTIQWGPCNDETLDFFGSVCGTLQVPLRSYEPNGTKVTLALSMHKHTVPDAQYQGIMLVNPGGPGGSGKIYSVFGDPQVSGLVSSASYDWIGFDPRGVGESTPSLSCDPDYNAGVQPDYNAVTGAGLTYWLNRTKQYARDCKAHDKGLLNYLTTADNARDMDAIRKAMGQKQLNYYGFSYGTYLGQTYSSLFPQNVRRQVFDGTVDPTGVWYRDNLDQDVAFDKNMDIWFGWLAQHDDVYGLGATGAEVKSLWYATRAKATTAPIAGAVGPSEWTDVFLGAGYYQSTWTELGSVFSDYIVKGDAAPLLAENAATESLGDDNGYAMYLGTQCSEGPWPKSWDTWKADNAAIFKDHPFETWANAWFNAPCIFWQGANRTPVTIDGSKVASTLMVNETLDAATPYSGSLVVRKLFPNARLIATPGGTTHSNSLAGNPCVDGQIDAYLLTGALPARKAGNQADATCAPLPQPTPELSLVSPADTSGTAISAARVHDLLVREQLKAEHPTF
jgi:pimeloyl-ACP methyl ester carboxylesterase